MTKRQTSDRPVTGVFIAWDEEEVDVERRDAGTVWDRTVVVGRRTVTRQALWSNEVSDKTVAAAESYATILKERHADYLNLRVQVFTKTCKRV